MTGLDQDRGAKDERQWSTEDEQGTMPEPGSPLGDPADDPRWTAWALGEEDALDPKDRAALAAAVAADEEADGAVAALREMASVVSRAYEQEHAGEVAGEDGAALSAEQRRMLRAAQADSVPRRDAKDTRGRGKRRGARRSWFGFPRRPLPALGAVAIAIFLVIPVVRWGLDQSISWRAWYQQVSSPDSFTAYPTGSIGRDVIDPPPPRPFVDYLLWRSADESGSMSGRASGADGAADRGERPLGLPAPPSTGVDGHAQSVQPPATGGSDARASAADPAVDAELADPSRRIVLEGRMRAEVADVMAAADEISAWVIRRGGFVESSRMAVSEDGGGASLVLRIPRLEFDALRRSVRERAVAVLADESDRVDATARHADLRERLRSLRTTEAELRELLAAQREAGRETKDVLEIFDLLKEYREQIEGLEGQLGVLQEQSTLSTLTLELLPHRPPPPTPTLTLTPTPTPSPEPVTRFDRIGGTAESAGADLLDGLELVVRGLLYLVIAVLPPLLLLVAFVWTWWWGMHRIAAWWSRTRLT